MGIMFFWREMMNNEQWVIARYYAGLTTKEDLIEELKIQLRQHKAVVENLKDSINYFTETPFPKNCSECGNDFSADSEDAKKICPECKRQELITKCMKN
jgi:predicted RNA-binding Zn-ribbon protein involved in translation (DUF1610 family)